MQKKTGGSADKAEASAQGSNGSAGAEEKDKEHLTLGQRVYYAELGAIKTLLDLPNRVLDYFVDAGRKAADRRADDRQHKDDGRTDDRPMSRKVQLAERGAASMLARAPRRIFDRFVEEGEASEDQQKSADGESARLPDAATPTPTTPKQAGS